MKIGLSGTQGVGKTTLMKILKQDSDFKYYYFAEEIIRKLTLRYDIKINEMGSEKTQMLICNSHVNNILIYDNLISDRTILDNYIYSLFLYEHDKLTKDILDIHSSLFKYYIKFYDHIFYIPPEFELEDDGFRSTDIQFQTDTHEIFLQIINELNDTSPAKISLLTGTVSNRIKQIKTWTH